MAFDEISAGTFLSWDNTLSEPVEMFWISPNGVWIKWTDAIQPGEGTSLDTIIGWVWVIVDSSGTCQMVIGGPGGI